MGFLGARRASPLPAVAIPALHALIPVDLPAWMQFSLDRRTIAFAASAAVGTGLVIGATSLAWHLRPNLANALRQGDKGGLETGPSSRLAPAIDSGAGRTLGCAARWHRTDGAVSAAPRPGRHGYSHRRCARRVGHGGRRAERHARGDHRSARARIPANARGAGDVARRSRRDRRHEDSVSERGRRAPGLRTLFAPAGHAGDRVSRCPAHGERHAGVFRNARRAHARRARLRGYRHARDASGGDCQPPGGRTPLSGRAPLGAARYGGASIRTSGRRSSASSRTRHGIRPMTAASSSISHHGQFPAETMALPDLDGKRPGAAGDRRAAHVGIGRPGLRRRARRALRSHRLRGALATPACGRSCFSCSGRWPSSSRAQGCSRS